MSWDYLSYKLACWGIPSDVAEIETDDYEWNEWRPDPNSEAITITISKEAGDILSEILPHPIAGRSW